MGKRLHRLSFYTLILAVYGIFFSIESFYNFEGHSEAREIIRHSSYLNELSDQAGVKTVHSHFPNSHPIRLRLNKRYHQEDIQLCTVYTVVAPVITVRPYELGMYPLSPLPAVPFDHPKLRGPPFAA
jgi:hypothetical protein